MPSRITLILVLIIVIVVFANVTYAQESDCGQDDCSDRADIPEYGISEEEILAYAGPDTESLTTVHNLLHDRRYQQVNERIDIYDAPNGIITRTLDAGFNFLTVLNVRDDGWTQINSGEWVQSSYLQDSNHSVSSFTGVILPEIIPQYPIAWMLINAHPATVPGGQPVESNGLIYRYTQVNIFSSVEIEGWRWYQIGVDKWVQQTSVAKLTPVQRPESVTTSRWISIDLYEQTLIAYEGEKPIFGTLVATGLPRWPTYEGTFNIYYRRVRHDMSWGTPGDDFYYLEEVPWTMFFDEGRALHGAYWHDGFGYRRSHGCVNLSITDANWLYNWVAEDFERVNSPDIEEGPAVYVFSSDEYQ
jgi:hypothetical protein